MSMQSRVHKVLKSQKKLSLSIQVVLRGKKIAEIHYGKKFKYYDLASLTKIIFTVAEIMTLVEQKKIRLEDSISKYLPWWPYSKVKISDTLKHVSGLSWWAPFYDELKGTKNNIFLTREQVKRVLLSLPVNEGSKSKRKSIYSDLDFILLGFVLEEVLAQPLSQIWQNTVVHRQIKTLHFNNHNRPKHARKMYAPTEKCPWRKKILRGEVHDDNTWSFGGVSTHAGLFGTIDDVTKFGALLRNSFLNSKKGARLSSTAIVRRFTKRAIPRVQGDWAMGFMLPTMGSASCGKYFSKDSIGHTGFTGTSLWFDPQKDLIVSILSNRVYPTRKNKKFVKLRPLLHDCVVEELVKAKLL